MFGSVVRNFFPSIRISTVFDYTEKKHKSVYKGVSRNTLSPSEAISFADIRQKLPNNAMILHQDNMRIQFLLPSQTVCNGSIVMKEVEIRANESTWSLTIRGKTIDLESIGISNIYNNTAQCLANILDIILKIKLCLGILVNSTRQVIPPSFKKEFVSVYGNENTGAPHLRSKACSQILAWTTRSEACIPCQKSISRVEKVNAEYWESALRLAEYDDKDMNDVFEEVFKGASSEMKEFLRCQHDMLQCSSGRERRWPKPVIRVCLNLFARSRQSYRDLQDSGILILPSGRQLQRYKNAVPQSAGLDREMFRWMFHSAEKVKVTKAGRYGGLMHDEMKIQEDLVLRKTGDVWKLVGWVDTGEEAFNLAQLKSDGLNRKLASHVLQIIFIGYTGFRFPVAHFPTDCVTASELQIIMWNTISELQNWGFTVDYILQDGGEQNRDFIAMHFSASPLDERYLCTNISNPSRKIALVQDYSHILKKIRNSVLNSGVTPGHTRCLCFSGTSIVWTQWLDAAKWDRSSNPRRVHHAITESHLHPNPSEKMRNHLAEDMMGTDMLHLMQLYQATLQDGSELNGAIELLQKTSILVDTFRDRRGISSMTDIRLPRLREVQKWFLDWEKDIKSMHKGAKASKMLPTHQCLDDLQSLLLTFETIVATHMKDFPESSVVPSR